MSGEVLKVAVPVPLRRLFDYLPPGSGAVPGRGSRVTVPYAGRTLTGVVFDVGADSQVAGDKLKSVIRCLDPEPAVDGSMLALLEWAAGYYHHPPGEAVRAVLPGFLRSEAEAGLSVDRYRITEAGRAALEQAPLRGARQHQLLSLIGERPRRLAELPSFGSRSKVLAALLDRGMILTERVESEPGRVEREAGPVLNPAQARAVARIADALGGYHALLLHGVTGSGKTEVYLEVVNRVIASGGQALVLVPEISLTPQTVDRFRRRTGARVCVYHSGLGETARSRAWWTAARGHADIVLGTRSAVFCALKTPGIIVVDEEHDGSYKQQDGFRYNARDLAVMRARRAGIPVVLGSATPSIETEYNCRQGRYQRLGLPERTAGARPPRIVLVDMERTHVEQGLSTEALAAIAANLESGQQTLVYINRRGFAPVVMCYHCDWQARCLRCDARLVLHRGTERLRCHHCGAGQQRPPTCPQCGSEKIYDVGHGTQRVEDFLKERFESARIERIDRDASSGRGVLADQLDRVRDRQVDILVGTQMLTKGHDFPGVTLVVVMQADHGLFGIDFRAPEVLFQQIVQVSGRAGRAELEGTVLIQTSFPEHGLIQKIRDQDYDGFVADLLEERRRNGFPPFRFLALFRAESHRENLALESMEVLRSLASPFADRSGAVDLMWPVAAPMARRAGMHRAQLLVAGRTRPALHAVIGAAVDAFADQPVARRVRWSVDVDPLDLF